MKDGWVVDIEEGRAVRWEMAGEYVIVTAFAEFESGWIDRIGLRVEPVPATDAARDELLAWKPHIPEHGLTARMLRGMERVDLMEARRRLAPWSAPGRTTR